MRDDPAVTGLVTRARNGEEQAWGPAANRPRPDRHARFDMYFDRPTRNRATPT
jgi:hypothetical protein